MCMPRAKNRFDTFQAVAYYLDIDNINAYVSTNLISKTNDSPPYLQINRPLFNKWVPVILTPLLIVLT